MKLFLPVVVAFVGVVAALPPHSDIRFVESLKQLERNTALEQLVLNLLEDLRQSMRDGDLDPLEVATINLQGDEFNLPGSHIHLDDVTVSKLSTFEVDTLDISLTSLFPQQLYTLTFDGRIPSLEVHAREYDLFLGALGYKVFGNGELNAALIEPRLSGSVVLRLQILGGMRLTVQSSNLSFQLAGFQSNILGLFHDSAMSAFVNSFLSYLVPNAVLLYEADISAVLNELVPVIANDILSNIDIGGILP